MTPKRSRKGSRPKPNRDVARAEAAGAIVGVGASAGGVEALQELFGGLGADTGMAYLVVQHLSPTHASMLAEILARATTMPVEPAESGMRILPGHVYVVPPDHTLSVARGRLRLGPRPEGPERHLPIDHLFRSIAQECGGAAIGVVLSGNASDGSEGLRAIKSAGGITFAQDEQSAKHPEMPRSAVAAGVVDVVLPPAGIARELRRLREHPYVKQRPTVDEETPPAGESEAIGHILETVAAVTGTDFTHYKQTTVRRRILRRMALARIEGFDEYLAWLRSSREEVEALHADVLINVTSFFRDPVTFKVIQRRVLPALLKRSGKEGIRIWVPGCSTGEEVYSIAICVLEGLGERAHGVRVQVFGTDMSEAVVGRARAGRYPAAIEADVSPERLRQFFTPVQEGYQVGKPLREVCVFAKHDLLKDPPFSRIDLVSCRNVLIYFGPVLQKKALTLIHYALKDDGILLLGSSEHVATVHDLFAPADRKNKVFAKKPHSIRGRLPAGGDGEQAGSDGPGGSSGPKRSEGPEFDIQREVDRILSAKFFPAGAVVDDEMQIVQFRGDTGPYLQPRGGSASLNLLKMARESLHLDLRTAFQRARVTGLAVRRERVRMKADGHLVDVAIEVVPFTPSRSTGRLFLVLFSRGVGRTATPPKRIGKAGPRRAGRARAVEQELAATKEYLQAIIEEQESTNEELMSANEEILTSNEELQSTNEELETAKEELMSSNEELSTVNDDLQNRNNEMHDLNTDLSNLLGTIQVPLLILDTDLKIRRVTPPAERLLNLIATDLGRKVTEIRPRLDLPDIARHVAEVVDTLAVKDVEVHDDQGRWYSMRIRPSKTRTHRIDGVVITWTEIDPSRPSEARGAHGYGDALLERMAQPAAILTADMRIGASNAAWRAAFPVTLDAGRWRPDPDALDGAEVRARQVRLRLVPGGPAVDLEAKPLEGRPGTTEGAILLTLTAT